MLCFIQNNFKSLTLGGYTLKVQPELWWHGRREMSQTWHIYVLESKWLYFKVILIRYLSLSLDNMVWSVSYFHWFYPEDNVVYKPQFMFCQVTHVLVSCGNNYLYSDCKYRKLKWFWTKNEHLRSTLLLNNFSWRFNIAVNV